MRDVIRKWHSITLQSYQAMMFESLIHRHNIVTESPKIYTFENDDGGEVGLKGYFAMKEVDGKKSKYFIEEESYPKLPIRVNSVEEMFYKESARSKSVILRPTEITPFRITPKACWESNKEFIDSIAPFEHSMPDMWTLNKIVAIMAYIGKTSIGICSLSEFGKTSIYLILDSLTKKCPVFQPRSVPGVLVQITGNGNMVFDEVHEVESKVIKCMENFSLQVAGNSPLYINGAMKSKNTKAQYDVAQQSITYLYNVYGNYANPNKQFWDNIWANKKAMESRFLTLRFEGKLIETFDKNFNIPMEAQDNKMFYIKVAKHLMHLKSLKFENKYVRRYTQGNHLVLTGRHKAVYDELAWGIDVYSESQAQYDSFITLLNGCIQGYKDMINGYSASTTKVNKEVVEERVLSDSEAVMQVVREVKEITVEELLGKTKVAENVIKALITAGDLYEVRPGIVREL